MEKKVKPYNFSDWALLAVFAQALIDLFTPNGTFGGTIALAGLAVGFRFAFYLIERVTAISFIDGTIWAVVFATAIFCLTIYFLPDGMMHLVRLSGK